MAKHPTDSSSWPSVRYESHPWERPELILASHRAQQQARGDYLAAIPPFIADLTVQLAPGTSVLADEASHELARFDAEAGMITAPFASILLRSEAASSSKIEHITSSAKEVALAEFGKSTSGDACLVVANVQAITVALAASDHLEGSSILATQDALLRDSAPEHTGRWRTEQAWIGNDSVSPHDALFVPPHHDRVPALMRDLVSFSARTDVPVLAHIAIAHAQLETIHPFPDGNGRTGRALLQGMLRHTGLTRNVTVPISAGLLHNTVGYFGALTAYRDGNPNEIVAAVSNAAFAAVGNSRKLGADIQAIEQRWDGQVTARSDSSVHLVKKLLLRQPVVNAKSVAVDLRISEVAAQSAINLLVDAGVLAQISAGNRNRIWQASEILQTLDAFGRRARRR